MLLACLLGLRCGPIGPLSGGHPSSHEGDLPSDLRRAAEVGTAQLETNPESPSSINIWFVVDDGHAFVATSLRMDPSQPEQCECVTNDASDPHVRIRIGENVYPARLDPVLESSLRA